MTYILSKDLPPLDSNLHEKRYKQQWRAYEQHLQKIAKKLPPSVKEYAQAEWHYDPSDHRCPHDSWLEHIIIRELANGERSEIRSLEIEMRLLGAYHDGHLEFIYSDVESYCLNQPYREGRWETNEKGHKDWMVDEIDLSRHGYVWHEIEWQDGGHWMIECKSFEYRWIPKTES